MMLKVAIEEKLTAFLGREDGERRTDQKGSRGVSKPPLSLPPRATRMDEIQHVIPLLYMNGLSTRKVKEAVARLLGKRGLAIRMQ